MIDVDAFQDMKVMVDEGPTHRICSVAMIQSRLVGLTKDEWICLPLSAISIAVDRARE